MDRFKGGGLDALGFVDLGDKRFHAFSSADYDA